jgi:hypothetical protein
MASTSGLCRYVVRYTQTTPTWRVHDRGMFNLGSGNELISQVKWKFDWLRVREVFSSGLED